MTVFLQAVVNGILLGGFNSLMGMGQNIYSSMAIQGCWKTVWPFEFASAEIAGLE